MANTSWTRGLTRLGERLTRPSATLTDPAQATRARLVSAVMLAISAPALVVTWTLLAIERPGWGSHHTLAAMVTAFLVACWALSRTRLHLLAPPLLATGILALVAAAASVNPDPAERVALAAHGALAIIGSAVLLRVRDLLWCAAAALGAATYGLMRGEPVGTTAIVLTLTLLAQITALALGYRWLRHRDRARADARARASVAAETLHRQVIDAALDGIVGFDAQGLVTSWNPQATAILGFTPPEALGQHVLDLICPDALRPRLERQLARFLAAGRSRGMGQRVETQALRKDGTVLQVEALLAPIRVDDAVSFKLFLRDITEHRRIEEQLAAARDEALAASRLKSQFLANMSHEIRTPMNGVIGMTSLLVETELTPEQREYVETIRESGDALLVLIGDLLDFARIESGRVDLHLARLELRPIVEEVLDLLAPRAAAKGLALVGDVPAALDGPLVGDAGRLRQMLLILVDNAVKFTTEGQVVVNLTEAGPERVRVEVRDTGPGVPEEARELIFKPFQQLDGSMSRRHGGAGLGLSICYELALRMGGAVGVDAGEDGGSVFWLEVPLPRELAVLTPMPAPSLIGLSALVVTEQPDLRRALVRLLTDLGAVAAPWAGIGHPPIRPDVIVVDAAGPGAASSETRAALATHPALAGRPWLGLVPLPDAPRAAELLGAPFAGYLSKPVRRRALVARLRALAAPAAPRARPPAPQRENA